MLATAAEPAERDAPYDGVLALAAQLRATSGPPEGLDDLKPLSDAACELIQKRLDAACLEGILRIDSETYCDVLTALMPEDFVIKPPTGPPAEAAPQTAGRIAVYADRATRGESVTRQSDADAVRSDRKGLRIRQRANGRGVQPTGYDAPPAEPLPAGMYRTAAGGWIELCEA